MSEQRNYAAEMAAYLAEHFMSAALQQFQVQGETRVEVLHALTDAVRRGSQGAFDALVRQLRPVLIRLAGDLGPEDPRELLSALFVSVKKHGDRTLPEIQARIEQAGWVNRRTWARETRKRGALRLVLTQDAGSVKDKKTGEMMPVVLPSGLPPGALAEVMLIELERLSPEEQYLWVSYADKTPVPEIANELKCSENAVCLRWFKLKRRLEERLRDLKK